MDVGIIGVYEIKSKIDPSKSYIGSSVNIKFRWNKHNALLKSNTHQNKLLQNHVNKYGIDDLEFKVIIISEKEHLLKDEQYFIDALNPRFNILKVAGSPLGHTWTLSDEAKIKLSKNKLGNKNTLGMRHSDETKAKIGSYHKGKIVSDETRRKQSEAAKGRKRTDEQRKAQSERQMGHVGYNLGMKHTDETKRLISEKHKGKKLSDEHKKKLSEAAYKRYSNKK